MFACLAAIGNTVLNISVVSLIQVAVPEDQIGSVIGTVLSTFHIFSVGPLYFPPYLPRQLVSPTRWRSKERSRSLQSSHVRLAILSARSEGIRTATRWAAGPKMCQPPE